MFGQSFAVACQKQSKGVASQPVVWIKQGLSYNFKGAVDADLILLRLGERRANPPTYNYIGKTIL